MHNFQIYTVTDHSGSLQEVRTASSKDCLSSGAWPYTRSHPHESNACSNEGIKTRPLVPLGEVLKECPSLSSLRPCEISSSPSLHLCFTSSLQQDL